MDVLLEAECHFVKSCSGATPAGTHLYVETGEQLARRVREIRSELVV